MIRRLAAIPAVLLVLVGSAGIAWTGTAHASGLRVALLAALELELRFAGGRLQGLLLRHQHGEALFLGQGGVDLPDLQRPAASK